VAIYLRLAGDLVALNVRGAFDRVSGRIIKNPDRKTV
jgi:hypothetical protein